MVIEPVKTVEEYTMEFKNDYELIVNYGQGTQLLPIVPGQNFEIMTVYTDKTPVTASNSSTIIAR